MVVDLNLDLDPTVEVDGSEAVRRRLTPTVDVDPLTLSVEVRGGRSVQVKVDAGVYVVRRRLPQRFGSRITSTSTITTHGLAAGRIIKRYEYVKRPYYPDRMEARLRLPRRATYADYLATEQPSERRHEFFDGVIVAMAGGSYEHLAIAGRLAAQLGSRLSGHHRYYSSHQRLWIPGRTRARYADGSVICGAPEHLGHDPQASINPAIVVEVLSPSSEGDDDGDKRRDFQSLASLEAYVRVAQGPAARQGRPPRWQ